MKRKWTLEKCIEEGLKYTDRSDFRKYSYVAYTVCVRDHLLDIVCAHMNSKRKPMYYWTKETCQVEALKYSDRTSFSKSKVGAYLAACKNGWIDEICVHMISGGTNKKRCIYAYEFPDNHVYVGLTYNINKRKRNRAKDASDSVTEYILKTGLEPIFKILTDFMSNEDAIVKEGEFLEKYINDGWVKLNKRKTGGIGGNTVKWTYDKCKEEALKYDNRRIFLKNNCSCLSTIYKNKWENDLLSHMKYNTVPNGYWNYDRCVEAANLCETKMEFRANFPGAYVASKVKGWYTEITSHTKTPNRKKIK